MTTLSKSLFLGSITAILYYINRINTTSGTQEAKKDDRKASFFADSNVLNSKV